MFDKCQNDRDHHDSLPIDLTRQEVTRASEGICPGCNVTAAIDNGWSVCPCCDVAWQIDATHIAMRGPFVVEDDRNLAAAEVG